MNNRAKMVGRQKVKKFFPFAEQNMPSQPINRGVPVAPGLRTGAKKGKAAVGTNLGGKVIKLRKRP